MRDILFVARRGFAYEETFRTPTLKKSQEQLLAAKSFRILMAIAAKEDLDIEQSDAINAFLNSKLNELIYCELPEGFPEDEEGQDCAPSKGSVRTPDIAKVVV